MKNCRFVNPLLITGFMLLAFTGLNAQNDGFFRQYDDFYNDFYNDRDNVNINDGGGMTVEPFGGGAPLGSGLLIMSLAGAGYVALKRRRLLKKGTALMLATLMLLGLTTMRKKSRCH